ncbi:conserved hypothetical protein [Carnobacterium maltaromaticum]|uniref:glycoside hydrolase domain-containing protein n=1 Tax=Carnobacterium maltaromaticum TaxID=2751 RepID=UPI00191BA77B|nr:glycoside hydrolase domain-containing protein [Carnobacterium maltaromaticum]CAD5902062.1 conserved hypothetical protein [Carnobacterium maltaromaticum]
MVKGDAWVFEVQEWLNKTYGNTAGFGSVPEDGRTGWPTVYGLIRALQIEMKLPSLADNFGPSTMAKWDSEVTPNLKIGFKSNYVKIIDGAFRCKGFGYGKFSNIFESENELTIKNFNQAAGFKDGNERFSSKWAKALFDMSAFRLVSGGKAKTQEIQQYLNRTYSNYTGILPCDGIYQRQTNEALIYGLQAEMGMSPSVANGYFGEGTTLKCPTLSKSQGSSNNIKILQMSLYSNGYYEGKFDGIFSSKVEESVLDYRKFMIIKPYRIVADMPVIKALLATTGDTNRTCEGFDASTRMTQPMIDTVKSLGMSYAGRYLTGTVGSEENERPKNLTIPEARLLIDNGMKIIPIYQDNDAKLENYNYDRGIKEGLAAFYRAYELGIPGATTIYFAVDVDTTLDEIYSNIVPYFKGVGVASTIFRESFANFYYYVTGVYAPRNVCKVLHDENLVSPKCYVSNMSTGFSANLGYPQPKEWAFDQFFEPLGGIGSGLGKIGIDKVAVSGRVEGFNVINPEKNQLNNVLRALKWSPLTDILNSGKLTWGKEITIADLFFFKATIKPVLGLSPKEGSQIYMINEKGLDLKFKKDINDNFDVTMAKNIISNAESLSANIKNGDISLSVTLVGDKVSCSITINVIDHEFEEGAGKVSFSMVFKIEISKIFFDDFNFDWGTVKEAIPSIVAITLAGIIFAGVMTMTGGGIAAFLALALMFA